MPRSAPIDSAQIDGLSSQFQRRWEAGFAWTSACSAFQLLPGLRGLWPMSAIQSNGDAFDQSGNGRLLTYNGDPTYNVDGLAPYIDLDGTGDFLSRADEAGLSIRGTEPYVAAARRGLTLGGWFWADTLAVSYLIAKGNNVTHSYILFLSAAGDVTINVHQGAAVVSLIASSNSIGTGEWFFAVGRFVPSTSVDIYLQNIKTTNAAAIVASIQDDATPFLIGERSLLNQELDGRVSVSFLCAAALSDAEIWALYHKTKALFGVK